MMWNGSRSGRLTRREILARSAGVAGAAAGLGAAPRRALCRPAPANEKLDVAFIGSGGQAGFSLAGLADQNIVALCDVDSARAAKAFKAHPKARTFADYRRMLDKMHKQIDAVVVCTPDHMHAPASLAAMRLGKGVYCEKPLCWCIGEARQMAAAARKHKVATQMGTQGMAMSRARQGVEVLRSGVLGAVRELHVWSDRPRGWWPQGVERPTGTPPAPAALDWDLWLGVAPRRPYHPDYAPFKWRGWLDFGTGPIGDMGIHNAAMAWMGLELGLPSSAKIVESSPRMAETFPSWCILQLEFPARGPRPPVTMHWYDGGKKPPAKLIQGREPAGNGAIAVGEKGTLYSVGWTGADWHFVQREKFRDYKPPEPTLPRVESHHKDWVAACKGGKPALCNFPDFAAPLTEVMLLGALAIRTGKPIQWDPAAMKAIGCGEADALIQRRYRKGWEI